jgi:acyl-CoA synthetase (AMP-forming)/AMP-acid ligase II
MKDNPTHIAALIAAMRVGAVILPLDWRSAVLEISRVTERFPPKIVLVDDERPLPEPLAAIRVVNIAEREADQSASVALVDQPMIYSLTSGTTGAPKAIVLTHEEMFGRLTSFFAERIIRADDRILSPLPLAYSAGRVLALTTLTFGASLIMFPTMFDVPT